MPAVRAQAILPSIPTLEHLITAQTGSGTPIRGGLWVSTMVAFFAVDFPTHGDPQRSQDGVKRSETTHDNLIGHDR